MSSTRSDADATGRIDSLAHAVGDVANVLLLSPGEGSARSGECADLLAGPDATVEGDAATGRVLGVLYGPPDRFLSRVRTGAGSVPPGTTVLAVTDEADGEAVPSDGGTGRQNGGAVQSDRGAVAPTVETLPPDATGDLPSRVRSHLDDVPADERAAVCVDCLSDLLDDVGLTRTFGFVDDLTTRLSRADAAGHFHLDPSRHDAHAVDALATTFDAVVRSSEDGEWTLVWKRLPDERGN